MKVSVVMPIYNECWTIREVVRRVVAMSDHVHELVMVDDGSTDGTRDLLADLVKKHKGHGMDLRLILKDRNEGKGAALREGFQAATGDVVLIQDADLEYDPADYPRLLAPLLAGKADVVYGSRFLGGDHNVLLFWHRLANYLLTLMCNLVTNLNLTDVWTCYKVFRADLIRRLPLTSRGFDFEPEVTVKLAKLGCRIFEVPVSYHGRTYAEGKKIGLKDAFIGLRATLGAWLFGDLGDLAVGEHNLRLMAGAARYNLYIYERFRPHLGREVIELGAGVGNVSRFLLDRARLVLAEGDGAALENLRRRFQGWEDVAVSPLDVARPGPEHARLKGQFDTVVCFNILEHVEDDRAALAAAAALAKPGGNVLVVVPAHPGLFGTLDRRLGHLRRYTRVGLESLLAGAGLEPVEVRPLNALSVPGWWLNGKLLRLKTVPDFQLSLFDRLTPLIRWTDGLRPSFGLSLFAVARRR
jgi:glycosyltransferase involved in cell wall biosynthesis